MTLIEAVRKWEERYKKKMTSETRTMFQCGYAYAVMDEVDNKVNKFIKRAGVEG